jgi:hypothetical protein
LPSPETDAVPADTTPFAIEKNPLESWFNDHKTGPGVWKGLHYFKAYHRHLQKFRGRKVNVLEIGIFSGGSLQMWQDYFGAGATIYGVDINPACKTFENDRIKVSIGDQGDRSFWRDFKSKMPAIDVLIDDGNHQHNEQLVTMQEMLPALARGGVYICEDVAGPESKFASFAYGMAAQLNGNGDPKTNAVQASIESISLYPYMVVLEKNDAHVPRLTAEKHGTEWIPPAGFSLGA